MIDTYPDLAVFRDIVFLFKLMMAPTSDSLPDLKRWRPGDAALSWSFKGSNKGDNVGQITVGSGFGIREMSNLKFGTSQMAPTSDLSLISSAGTWATQLFLEIQGQQQG